LDMKAVISSVFSFVLSVFRSRLSMKMEIIALRHQLSVYQRKIKKPKIQPSDRIFWSFLSKLWPAWKDNLYFVKPATIIAWRRKKFKEHWTKLCSHGKRVGRPPVDPKIIKLIRDMSKANPFWGSPRIKGELRKIGIYLAKSTIFLIFGNHNGQVIDIQNEKWQLFQDRRYFCEVALHHQLISSTSFLKYFFIKSMHLLWKLLRYLFFSLKIPTSIDRFTSSSLISISFGLRRLSI